MHRDRNIEQEKYKPGLILNHNGTKGNINILDHLNDEITCKCVSSQWSVEVYLNIWDFTRVASLTIWLSENPKLTRWNSLWNLVLNLHIIILKKAEWPEMYSWECYNINRTWNMCSRPNWMHMFELPRHVVILSKIWENHAVRHSHPMEFVADWWTTHQALCVKIASRPFIESLWFIMGDFMDI